MQNFVQICSFCWAKSWTLGQNRGQIASVFILYNLSMESPYVTGNPKLWLRLEGLVLLIATIILFSGQGQKWWLYPVLLFAPDIFMLGYLVNTKLGAFLYNLGHSYFAPALMILLSWRAESKIALAIGIIWLGHIGLDRLLGYGLKYDSAFKHTHLGDLNKVK
jgi:hypothetical protein